ncbi:cilia- and flagella-associated protein 43-like isoform X4 [Macrotis lagotis]|uniref:cilia- and flagella-associated protein 43-like isoform X4 n=1 Tax=Macrotis lagotis TaxID=92651 RepID=UPI003D695B62
MSATALTLRWVQGFPKQNIDFINKNTICYTCGNYLIFINIENGKRSVLQCFYGNVGAMATNIPFQVVAFSNRKLNPTIYLYNFPDLNRRSKLQGHAQLDYTLLEFSYCGTYLASYSAVPEYELTLWNWEKKVILCSKLQPGVEVSQMTFNPMNWHQLCLSGASALTIWNVEKSEKNYHFKAKSVSLPAEDGAYSNEADGIFSNTEVKDTALGSALLVSAIAGLVGVEAETFKPKDDLHPLLHPTVHCWNSTNGLYVGCEEGHILLINGESLLVTILNRFPEVTQEGNLPTLISSTIMTTEEKWRQKEILSKDTSVNTMAFHKEGLFVSGNDGILHSFTVKETHYKIKDYFDVQEPVETILFSPDYTLLLIETIKGSVYTYTFGEEPKVKTILDACGGNIQAVDFITPGNKYCMSVTILGEIYIWLLENGSLVSKLHLGTEVNDMACCPSSLSVAVGTSTGYIQFLDITNIVLPVVVHNVFLTRSSIQHVHYDQKGQYLITGTSDGYIFILNAKPSKSFQVLGFTEMNGNIVQISTVYISKTNLLEIMVLLKTSKSERSILEIFYLPEVTLSDPDNCCDVRGRLKNDIIERRSYETNHCLTSAILDSHSEQLFGFCSHVPYICSYGIPEKDSTDVVLKPEIKKESRHFGTGILCLSSHGKWLASTAKDGILSLRNRNDLEIIVQTQCHSYQGQGIQSLAFSLDGHSIIVSGREDGALVCLKWKKITESLAQEASEHFQTFLGILNNSIAKEKDALMELRDIQHTWDLISQQSAFYKSKSTVDSFSEDYSGVRDGAFKQETSWLEKKNHEANRKEVEEFSEKKKELKEGIKALAKTIEKMIEENDLASETAQLELQEFTLDVEEMKRLHNDNEKEVIKLRKETEMENLAKMYLWKILKEECWDSMSVKGQGLMSFHTHLQVQNFPMKEQTPEELEEMEKVLQQLQHQATELKLRKEIVDIQSTSSLEKTLAELREEEEEEEEDEEKSVKRDSCLPSYEIGSLCTSFGANTSTLINQLEIHTRDEKINQIILLKIKFEKYLTPWEKEQAEIAAAFELKQRLLAMRDDSRRQALKEMMNGVLEVKKEDILKMVIPQPSFMSHKIPEIWNEEERRQAKDYEKKLKELTDEKEKYKKSLDAELRKIQGSIQEMTQTFDNNLRNLFERKVEAEMVINQEELKITNLVFSLLLDEEINTRELVLNNFLERKQMEKKYAYKEVYRARDEVDTYRENYDNLIAEDKVIERGFKKEFAELSSHHAELLCKLFRRRPRMAKQKQNIESTIPFGERLGSGKIKKVNLLQIMKAMDDLDNPRHMPEGLDPGVWQYFCAARRTKIEYEYRVKQKAADLLEMQAFLQKRIEEDEKLQMDIDKIFQEQFVLQKDKCSYEMNLTIQFLLKQGQVEVENFHFKFDFSDTIIISRNIIEDLNNTIRTQAQRKIAHMVENKNYHKGIFQIEWEHKKMVMEMEDLNQKAWDIQSLFFSKAHQRYLKEQNYDIMLGSQILLMEQTIAAIDKAHKKNVDIKKQILEKLRKINSQKDSANFTLSCLLYEELVANTERKNICQSLGFKLTYEKMFKERYEAAIQQQRLIDISKQQYEEISILQAEVERLRMKTFPALIHM